MSKKRIRRSAEEPILCEERPGYTSGHREFQLFIKPDVYAALEKMARNHNVTVDDEVELIMLGFFKANDLQVYKEMRQHYEMWAPRLLDVFDGLSERHE